MTDALATVIPGAALAAARAAQTSGGSVAPSGPSPEPDAFARALDRAQGSASQAQRQQQQQPAADAPRPPTGGAAARPAKADGGSGGDGAGAGAAGGASADADAGAGAAADAGAGADGAGSGTGTDAAVAGQRSATRRAGDVRGAGRGEHAARAAAQQPLGAVAVPAAGDGEGATADGTDAESGDNAGAASAPTADAQAVLDSIAAWQGLAVGTAAGRNAAAEAAGAGDAAGFAAGDAGRTPPLLEAAALSGNGQAPVGSAPNDRGAGLAAHAAARTAAEAAGAASGAALSSASTSALAASADAAVSAAATATAPLDRTDPASTTPSASSFGLPAAPSTASAFALDTAPASAAAPATDARLYATPGSPEFAAELGARLTTSIRDGVHHARLELNPAEMGPLTVQIAIDGSSAQLQLSAENAQTRQALEQALPLLAGSLREAGLTLSGGGVFEQPRQREEAGRPADGQGRGSGRDGGADTGAAAAPAAVVRRGVVDLVA